MTKRKLSPKSKAKAKVLDTNVEDMSLKDVKNAIFGKLKLGYDVAKTVATKAIETIVPDDANERNVREAESHIANAERTAKTAYAVNRLTGWVGSIGRGITRGVKDSLNENLRGKPTPGAKKALEED